MRSRVPPPPVPQPPPVAEEKQSPSRKQKHPPLETPLDAAFIQRIYVTTFYLGLIWTACAWGLTRSAAATGSFVGGLLLGALLLKSQELFVRLLIAPRVDAVAEQEQTEKNGRWRGWLTRVPVALMLPLKYGLVGLAFSVVIARDWLHPGAMIIGFLTVQVVILSKVVGRVIDNRLKKTE